MFNTFYNTSNTYIGTYPLDTIKTRLQVQGEIAASKHAAHRMRA